MEENSLSIISLILSAGFVVQIVMAILVLMSIYSWTVIMACLLYTSDAADE